MLRARKFKELETKLGHRFKDPGLLERALTHASVRGGKIARFDNERLEFIGDRVLGLAIAEILNQQYPEASEGELARRTTTVSCAARPAPRSRATSVSGRISFFRKAKPTAAGVTRRQFSPMLPKLLGAVFIDVGFEKARTVVRKLWQEQSEPVPEVAVDAKSALQEWAQGQGLALPKYTVVSRKGPDHAPRFTAEVIITGRAPAQGEGAWKFIAEQAAATALLTREGEGGRLGEI